MNDLRPTIQGGLPWTPSYKLGYGSQGLFTFLGVLLLSLVIVPRSTAQSHSHQRNILPGGRATMLGGAYTALSDDPAGGYYNPAGISHAKENEISLSGNAYLESTTTYKEAVNGQNFVEGSRSIYPSFLGANYRWKDLTVGYSYLTLDSHSINQDHRFTDISTAPDAASSYNRTNQENNTYIHAGASLAYKFSKNISLGVSGFYYRRNTESTTHQMTKMNGGGLLAIDFKYETVNEGYDPVVGFMYRGDMFSLGASWRAPKTVNDRTTYTNDTIVYLPVSESSDVTPTATSARGLLAAMNEPNPQTAQVGFAFFPSPVFLLSADVLYHAEAPGLGGAPTVQSTYNYSLGFESMWNPLVLRLGAFTNNSMYREPKVGRRDQPTWIDLRGVSGGLGFVQKDRESALGIVRQTGRGKSQIVTGLTNIQEVEAESTSVFLSARVYL